MTAQQIRTSEELLEEARSLIGVESALSTGRYPVEYDPIRRYCHMSGDTNPLFLDPDYAKQTKYGEVICPPLMVGYFAGGGPWPRAATDQPEPGGMPPPGFRGINLATEGDFYRPVKVGDRLSSKRRVGDAYMKPIRLDPQAVWIVNESLIYNQDGELVAKTSGTGLRHRLRDEAENRDARGRNTTAGQTPPRQASRSEGQEIPGFSLTPSRR